MARGRMSFRTALFSVLSVLFAVGCDAASGPPDGSFLSEGDRAPGFTLPSASGEQVALSDFTSRKPVLLYFSMGPG